MCFLTEKLTIRKGFVIIKGRNFKNRGDELEK